MSRRRLSSASSVMTAKRRPSSPASMSTGSRYVVIRPSRSSNPAIQYRQRLYRAKQSRDDLNRSAEEGRHRLEDVGRLGAGAVVGVNVDPADRATGVDDDDRRHRHGVVAVGVGGGDVDAEGGLAGPGVVAGGGEDAELAGDLVTGIGQDGVGEFVALLHREGAVGGLR